MELREGMGAPSWSDNGWKNGEESKVIEGDKKLTEQPPADKVVRLAKALVSAEEEFLKLRLH